MAVVAQNKTHCSPFPPHEQLLVAAVGGAVVVVVLGSSSSCPRRPLILIVVLPSSSCSPRRRPGSSTLSFHPRSTPRAVAREAGGGWCVIHSGLPWCRRRLSSFSLPTAPRWCCCLSSSSHLPPHEQLLVRLGAGCVVSCSSPVPSLLLSTLRAEARNSGGAGLSTVSSRRCSTIET